MYKKRCKKLIGPCLNFFPPIKISLFPSSLGEGLILKVIYIPHPNSHVYWYSLYVE